MKLTRLSGSNLQGKCLAPQSLANSCRPALQALLQLALATVHKYRP
jgi:hypothetical protein